MQEKGAGVKRGQWEHVENLVNAKLRRREGIKRGLQDIEPISYEEYDNSWDLEDQSKRCKRAVNCLLVSCGCKRETAMIEPIRREQGDDVSTVEHSQTPTMPVHVIPVAAAEQGKRARSQNTAGTVQPVLIPGPSSNSAGRYSDTSAGFSAEILAASSNSTSDTVSQSIRDTRRRNRAWGSSLVRIGVMLLFMFLSLTVTEGVKDWSQSSHQRYITIGILQPRMHNYRMSGEESFSSNKIERNLTTRNQGVLRIRECYVPNIRDTRLVSVHRKNAISMEGDLLQHAEARGPNVRCVSRDRHGIIGYAG